MTITRRRQTGFEIGDLNAEVDSFAVGSSSAVALVSDVTRTGNFSLRTTHAGTFAYTIASTSQARVSFHFRHPPVAPANSTPLVSFQNGTTEITRFRWNGSAFDVVHGTGTVLTTVTYAPFNAGNQWFHLSVDVKVAGSGAGWFRLYADGVMVIDWTGTNTGGGTAFNTVRFGTGSTGASWGSGVQTWYDDIYMDDTTGEGSPSLCPDLRYLMLLPNGNGDSSQWIGSDGNSDDNFLLVDEMPHDGEGTYVTTSTHNQRDTYALRDLSLPPGWSVTSVIPLAAARKDSGSSTAQLRLLTKLGANETLSDPIPLPTDYAYVYANRQLTKPGGGAWTTADVNDTLLGIQHHNP